MEAKIYNFADLKIAYKADRHGIAFKGGECPHNSLEFDPNGETITCKGCGKPVTPWWAFMNLVRYADKVLSELEAKKRQIAADEARGLTHKAAIRIEDAWRRRKYIPTCPHCHKAITPADGFGGGMASKRHYESDAKPLQMIPALEVER